MNSVTQLVLFVAVLAVMKFAFGLPVSIVGSLLLTVVLSLVMMGFQRSR